MPLVSGILLQPQAGGLLLDAKHPVLFSVIVLVASNS